MSDWGISDYQGFDGGQELSVVKPKWTFLVIGYLLTSIMLLIALLVRPTGSGSWIVYVLLWLSTLAAYLIPFSAFVTQDFDLVAKNPNADHLGRQNLGLFRNGLLLSGFLVSMIYVYLAAEEISRNLNAI